MRRRFLARILATALAVFSVVMTSGQAISGEDGLYGAAVPNDAVFIRSLGTLSQDVALFGRSFAPEELPANIYVAISAGAVEGAEPGTFHSVYIANGAQIVIPEPVRDNPAKVYLFLLNIGSAPARLVIDRKDAEVIGWTEPSTANARAVNPVSVTLGLESGGDYATTTVTLRRGQNLTLLASDGELTSIPSEFGPVIETK